MAVISELIIEGENVLEHENSPISTISVDEVDYNFAKPNEVLDGVCENAVNEPIIDMQLGGNSVQNGTPTTESPVVIDSVGVYDEATGKYKVPIKANETITDISINEPLRKISTYADNLYYKDKKVVRQIKELVLTGEENWDAIGTAGSNRYYLIVIGEYGSVVAHNGMCTHFERKTISSSNELVGVNVTNSSGYDDARILIRPDLSKYPTLNPFVEFLKQQYANGTPVIVDYVLTTPIEETIEIPEISTLKGTTIINTDTSVQPSEIKINYWKQI